MSRAGTQGGDVRIVMLYFAQVRQAAGLDREELDLPARATIEAAADAAAGRHGDAFRTLVQDADGCLRASLLVLVNGVPASHQSPAPLRDGDTVSLMSAVAGG